MPRRRFINGALDGFLGEKDKVPGSFVGVFAAQLNR